MLHRHESASLHFLLELLLLVQIHLLSNEILPVLVTIVLSPFYLVSKVALFFLLDMSTHIHEVLVVGVFFVKLLAFHFKLLVHLFGVEIF